MMRTESRVWTELFRYGIVGGIAFVCDFLTLYILTKTFNIHYLISSVFGFFTGTIVNYYLSKNWAFKNSGEKDYKAFFLFTFIGIIGLGFTELGMWIGVSILDIDLKATKVCVTAIVFLWNFIARKLLVFNNEQIAIKYIY